MMMKALIEGRRARMRTGVAVIALIAAGGIGLDPKLYPSLRKDAA